ncbi:MAG: hypothetical protein DI551_06540 [Micavibrio aeruginosavorus]|uniref:Uncharacterized protein n=1 Tax=Micavibrio aeruginosavorus TaxID=349221 RepID=A0A2W5MY99_9BACT|nr:MAG: hypothetical protein DI551_06540 [Micavibrio aeruginosavorus]
MPRPNIKDVVFKFSAGPDAEGTLENRYKYRPSTAANEMLKNYSLQLPATVDKDIALHLHFQTDPCDAMVISAFEHNGSGVPVSPFVQAAGKLAEIDFSIERVLGRKDWRYYTNTRAEMDRYGNSDKVRTPYSSGSHDSAMDNFHTFLAARFENFLQTKGLVHKDYVEDDDNGFYMLGRALVGTLLEHKEISPKPQGFISRLMFRAT